jgi:lycopene cyclase domain-containing protein
MKFLYLLLNIGSISIPLLYSFHPKMNFKKLWKPLLFSTTLVAIIFILWDYIFTKKGIWGFNQSYFIGPKVFNMPFEEILFFFCIPYASIFIHYAMIYFKPNWQLNKRNTKNITIILITTGVLLLGLFSDRSYSLVDYSFFIITLILGWFYGLRLLSRFYLSFLFILIPFCIVNGILTGSLIAEPVVWYNNNENMGIRLFTIPIEDISYAFSMLFMNLLILNSININNND